MLIVRRRAAVSKVGPAARALGRPATARGGSHASCHMQSPARVAPTGIGRRGSTLGRLRANTLKLRIVRRLMRSKSTRFDAAPAVPAARARALRIPPGDRQAAGSTAGKMWKAWLLGIQFKNQKDCVRAAWHHWAGRSVQARGVRAVEELAGADSTIGRRFSPRTARLFVIDYDTQPRIVLPRMQRTHEAERPYWDTEEYRWLTRALDRTDNEPPAELTPPKPARCDELVDADHIILPTEPVISRALQACHRCVLAATKQAAAAGRQLQTACVHAWRRAECNASWPCGMSSAEFMQSHAQLTGHCSAVPPVGVPRYLITRPR